MKENIILKQVKEVYMTGEVTTLGIMPPDENGRQLILIYKTWSRSSKKHKEKVEDILISDKPLTNDKDIIDLLTDKSRYLKNVEYLIPLLDEETARFQVPETFWEPPKDTFDVKIVNNTGFISTETLTTLLLNNPRFNALVRFMNCVNSSTKLYVTMPSYEGKNIKEQYDEQRYKLPTNSLTSKSYKEYSVNNFKYDLIGVESINNVLTLFDKHPDYEDGIIAYGLKHRITIDSKTWSIVHTINCTSKIEHVPGMVSKVVKYSKKEEIEASAFEAFNLNTKNITFSSNVLWNCSKPNNWISFLWENVKYFEKAGFMTLLRGDSTCRRSFYYDNLNSPMISTFITYLVLTLTYPVFELLIKSGYTKLFFDAFEELKAKNNKREMDEYIKKFDELVDNTATKGKLVLRFPSYIGEYLRAKSAPLSEYFAWRDVYELENISNGLFAKIVSSSQFAIFNYESSVSELANVLKYGYTTEKLINFVVKEFIKNTTECYDAYSRSSCQMGISNYLNTLGDYLHMCDMLDIKPDMYPQDLKKVHDEVSEYYQQKANEQNDKIFAKISEQASSYVIPTAEQIADEKTKVSKLWNDYIVKFPSSEKELIEEGNMQHNCVGSYDRHILAGRCIIFFIRKKDAPEKSYITVECTRAGLGQCMFQNNRVVSDEDLLGFAKSISSKLIAGVRSGKINALSNL